MSGRKSSVFDSPDGKAQAMLVVGKTRQGKSHFCRYYITDRFAHAGWRFGLSFVGTRFTGAYDWLPPKTVVEGYDEAKLLAYMTNLKKKEEEFAKHNKRIADESKHRHVPPNFVFFDDLVGVLTSDSKAFQNFCTTARHTNTNIIVAVQYLPKGVSTTFREQVSHVVMFCSKNKRTLRSLHSEFGQLFPDEQAFVDWLWEITSSEPYTACLYLDAEQELGKNYLGVKAPAELPKGQLRFSWS